MSDQILVGTRKGTFRITRSSSGWAISDTWFLGDAVSLVLGQAERSRLFICQNLGHFGVKVQRSDDDGQSWQELPAPSYPEKPEGLEDKEPMRGIDIPWSTQQIWSLEQGGNENELWCGTIPGGLFHSTDGGDSWALMQALWNDERRKQWMGGGYDFPGIHSICVHPRNADHVTVAVSCGGVWKTRDRGENWELVGQGLRQDYAPPELAYEPLGQDPHRIVQAPSDPDRLWMQHHNGIFRSDDGGLNWTELAGVSPSVFGFAVAVHPFEPDTAWFVPAQKDEQRIPVDGRLVVNRTRDGGASFETLGAGLPSEHAYDLVYRHCLDVSADGNRLAFGSTTGGLWVSEDQGDHWENISVHLPPITSVRFN